MVGFIVARLTAEGEEFSVKVYGSRLLPLQNNHPNLTSPWLYPFEALAEIFDFAAGLVQRVPEKTSISKSDLLNSTASQGD